MTWRPMWRRITSNAGRKSLEDLGYDHVEAADPVIPILEKYFLTKENNVTKPLIDDRKLSEIDKIRAYAEGDLNYIEWPCLQNARENDQNIRDQKGFLDNKAPYASAVRHAASGAQPRVCQYGVELLPVSQYPGPDPGRRRPGGPRFHRHPGPADPA